jgi:hypothetical protein
LALQILREKPPPELEMHADDRERVVDIAPGPRTLRTTDPEVQALWEAIFARDNR